MYIYLFRFHFRSVCFDLKTWNFPCWNNAYLHVTRHVRAHLHPATATSLPNLIYCFCVALLHWAFATATNFTVTGESLCDRFGSDITVAGYKWALTCSRNLQLNLILLLFFPCRVSFVQKRLESILWCSAILCSFNWKDASKPLPMCKGRIISERTRKFSLIFIASQH